MDSPKPSPPPPPPPPPTDLRLENLKSLFMKCAIASTKSLTPPQETFIEERFHEFFPHTYHTPDHPPYAQMIETAIKQLDEEGGSTEDAISKFILQEYKDLPWAHAALLDHHLRKLSDSGTPFEIHDGCYMIRKANTIRKRTSKPSTSFGFKDSPVLSSSPSYSPSYSSSPTYTSTSTSSSSQNYSTRKRRKSKRGCQRNARGGIKIRQKCKEVRVRGRARQRGRGRGEPWKKKMMDQVEDEVEQNAMVIEVDSPGQQLRVNEREVSGDDCYILSTIPLSHRQKLINKRGQEQGSRKGRSQKRSIHTRDTPIPLIGTGGPCKKNLHIAETRKNVETLKEVKRTTVEESSLTQVCLINDDNMVPEWLSYDFPAATNTNVRERGIEMHVSEMEPYEGDTLDELIEEVYMELVEAPDLENLQIKEGKQDSVNVEFQAEPSTMMIEIDPQEKENKDNDDLNKEQLQESESAIPNEAETEMIVEPNSIDCDQGYWAEEQNHIKKHAQEDKGGIKGQIQLNDDKDKEVKEQSFTTGLEDEINKQSLVDGTGEMTNSDPKEREFNVDEENEGSGKPTVEVVIEQQFQPLPRTTVHPLELDVLEDRGGSEGQVQLKEDKDEMFKGQKCATGIEDEITKSLMDETGEMSNCDPKKEECNVGEDNECSGIPTLKVVLALGDPLKQFQLEKVEIIGKEKLCEGDCPLIGEENDFKNAFEIEQYEVIIEQNQPEEQHLILVDKDKKESEEFEHSDERRKSEKENVEQNPSGIAQTDTTEQKEQYNEDQNQQLEHITSLFSEEVEKTEHDQPIQEISTEIVKLVDSAEIDPNTMQNKQKSISGNMEEQNKRKIVTDQQQSDNSIEGMSLEVKSMGDSSAPQSYQAMDKPQCRQLRPRPTKDKPSESSQRRKLRRRSSKDVSSEAANRVEPLSARLRKRKGAHRSLMH